MDEEFEHPHMMAGDPDATHLIATAHAVSRSLHELLILVVGEAVTGRVSRLLLGHHRDRLHQPILDRQRQHLADHDQMLGPCRVGQGLASGFVQLKEVFPDHLGGDLGHIIITEVADDSVLLTIEQLAVAVVGLDRGLLHPQHLGGVIFEAGRRLAGLIAVRPLEERVGEFVRCGNRLDPGLLFGRPDDVAPLSRITQAHHPVGAARCLINSEPLAQLAQRGHPVRGVCGHGAED